MCDITFSSEMANNNVLVYVLVKSNGSVLACGHGRKLENDPGPVLTNDHGPVLASDTGQCWPIGRFDAAPHRLPLSRHCRKRNWVSIEPLTGGCLGPGHPGLQVFLTALSTVAII